jgi:hypothetical protein
LSYEREAAAPSSGGCPVRLSQAQLDQVMRTAQPIPPDLRKEYLVLVARSPSGRDFGDGDVYRECATAAKTVMWNVAKEAS